VGCRAITPHLVGLAKELEGKPFHLLATHCQNQPKESVVSYIKGKGVEPGSPNFTVTSFGGHPKVKGNGYVPYYMVFDHHGDLVHHHMCGQYHGGDGLRMIEIVDELLEKTPEIYLGKEPFEAVPKLAERVAQKKGLADTAVEIETRLADGSDPAARAELERLHGALVRYRDGKLGRAERLLASRPSQVLDLLEGLSEELGHAALDEPVSARIGELRTGDVLKRSLAVEKSLGKIAKSLDKLKGCKACKREGIKNFRASCQECRAQQKGKLASAVKKLEALLEDADGLPIAGAVEAALAALS
jgi:hypothetical protein